MGFPLFADSVSFLGISIVGQTSDDGEGGIYVGSVMKGYDDMYMCMCAYVYNMYYFHSVELLQQMAGYSREICFWRCVVCLMRGWLHVDHLNGSSII